MLDQFYDVRFKAPCDFTQRVQKITDVLFSGTGPNGTVLMQKQGATWYITIYASDPTSPCFPNATKQQDTPDPDPIGDYGSDTGTVSAV
ncbi:MAG: hypothetical protein AAGI37_06815 [Planctomycetota bacterium]